MAATVENREPDQRRGRRTSYRAAAWLAWSLCAVSLALLAAAATVSYLRYSSAPADGLFWLGLEFLAMVGFAAYPIVGALVVSRRPENAVGWLLCLVSLPMAAVWFTEPYVDYAQKVHAGSLPGVGVASFLDSINPGLFLATFVLLLFPDGRLPSRRWRPLVWVTGGGAVLFVAHGALEFGGPFPLGVELPGPVLEALWTVDQVLILAGILGAAASLLVRLRRSRDIERQQVKWLVYAASVTGVSAIGALLAALSLLPSPLGDVLWVVTILGFAAMPVAVGVAILRYRLYEIDIIINRTLVYGVLTATLALVYFGGVTTTQTVFRTLTGQEEQPQLAIVVSTLVIAALFSPLRRRIQAFIDRRFYRRKYDAAKTLEAFSAKLRDETDIERLGDEMAGVVWETMQPAHVGLWLRPDWEVKAGGREPRS
jgi:hypothetical protein